MLYLIADDENLARANVMQALRSSGDAAASFLEADNGTEALRLLRSHPVDVAFLDIRMPLQTGLDVAQQAQLEGIGTRIYILTGFQEFEYAQKAVRFGVKDFLLKPVLPARLAQIVADEMAFAAERRDAGMAEVVAQVSHQLFTTQPGLTKSRYHFLLALVAEDGPPGQTAQPISGAFTSGSHFFHFAKNGLVLYVLAAKQKNATQATAQDFFRFMAGHTGPAGRTIFCAARFCDIFQLRETLAVLEEAALYRAVEGTGGARLVHGRNRARPYTPADVAQLQAALDAAVARDYVQLTVAVKALQGGSALVRLGAPQFENFRLYWALCSGGGAVAFHDAASFMEHLERARKGLAGRGGADGKLIADAKRYIEENFSREITLASLAETMKISPNYLSAQFRKATGVRFTEYLAQLRIEKAQQMLVQSGLTIKEIADEVGYYSTSHFIKVFTSLVGVTPKTFRERGG